MIIPEPVASTTLIGNAAVSLSPPDAPIPGPAANAERLQETDRSPRPASSQTPSRRLRRLSIGLWLALLLWAMGAVLLALLNLASLLLAF
ncbi:hypothetical protein A7P25_07605 [Achromobacter xylosoxidans]|jgi:hypothetical protein|uniref:Uncharacterized protein n=1 Tax=Achromobacter ruhlandii TaxID=72557 RepID=A0A2M9GWQ7_9BURK|nr:hypothetical protein [Achromobacter ruhlandii]ALX84161.1 hypothetical protein APT56_13745 [Achromobacter denitrificans]OCZ61637.1 hypothetical protein A7P23_25785 [Achromobacter xylosoxidans]MCI1836702.1 hypothetical protein [Achromobacter ruhlandii]OCZ97263.1 hypothetical protein A7P25_07605 [Achromobacter xylosoxidans]ODA00147.1 hypothetical protein A9G00_36945 [Achromobacter xylosoxidans]